MMSRIAFCSLFLLPTLFCASATADDVRVLDKNGKVERLRTNTDTSKIVSHTKQGLVFSKRGKEQSYPLTSLVAVSPEPKDTPSQALLFFRKGQIKEAYAAYEKMGTLEKRDWARSYYLAKMAKCQREMGGSLDHACGTLEKLVSWQPQMPHLEAVPLAWTPRDDPDAKISQVVVKRWARETREYLALAWASQLLTSRDQNLVAEAVKRMNVLQRSQDPRVQMLAIMQLWRKEMGMADAAKVQLWNARAEMFEDKYGTLAAGPFYLVGQAWKRLKDYDKAAVAFLKVALVHPDERYLAARALSEAADCCEKAGKKEDAARLLQELKTQYPEQKVTKDETIQF